LAETELQEVQRVVADLESGAAFDARARVLMLDLLQQQAEATRQMIQPVDFNESIAVITADQEAYAAILTKLKADIYTVLDRADAIEFNDPDLDKRIERFRELNEQYLASLPEHRAKLAAWNQNEAIPIWRALVAFLAGKDWVTASDQQDWYGLLPLLGGSLLISIIALFFAVPFGVGAAIYVNQIAGPVERNLIKPYVEFVSAIPSVVIGFFGVVVFGEAIRQLSQFEFMAWVPFFPLQERLNAFTAGGLLALMAIPTIFTLAEDAINNIPRHFKEASFAVGATRLQTTLRVIVPSALSGIISAVMLGFGRVIGETMVVLLCAGNRIKIPDFSDGLGVFFQPVHTMTGIIAQEMGEVVRGSVHYRALFMVGIVLFFVSLLINYGAQWVVKKYRKVGD
jgi:phosphate transport system permease protein